MEKPTKFSDKDISVIMSQFYVAKELKDNPLKAVTFIRNNKKLFPNVTEDMLLQIEQQSRQSKE